MSGNGFIKLYRSMIDWEWFQDANATRVFLYLLLDANHKANRWMGKEILPGQTVTSYQIISKKTGISVQSVRTAISKLKSTGEITSQSTNKYTLITIENWASYQSEDCKSTSNLTNDQQTTGQCSQFINRKTTSKSTSKISPETPKPEGFTDLTESELTSNLTFNQQATNKQLTTNKNDKNDKKNIYGSFGNVKLTDDELQKLKDKYGDWQKKIDDLSAYIASKGKRYVSHYATILTWARKDEPEVRQKKYVN